MTLLLLNVTLASLGLLLGAVSRSGALAAFLVGATVALALGWPGYALLLLYFVLGTLTTRIGWTRKRALGIAEPSGGARGARQVLANGGPPALFAALAAALPPGWVAVVAAAFVGSLAAAAADTASSEIGKWLGGRTWRLTDFAPAAPGTPGAVSVSGSIAGLFAAVAVAAVAWAIGLLPGDLAVVAAAAGLAAALLEGLLVPLAARGFLDHDAMNAASVATGGLLALGAGLLV